MYLRASYPAVAEGGLETHNILYSVSRIEPIVGIIPGIHCLNHVCGGVSETAHDVSGKLWA